ncbi:MAG: LytTR family DNA-binding domain-containing protein [Gammaproteobacteria bacterium]|jgi:two-component system response regulator AlgR|nr:LytTR family DNA-binding domain-containing protein [Gammaproteobacteria bacterium]
MKILIVDDEKLARARLRELILQIGGGHSVAGEAINGSDAIEKTMKLRPEVLLMDIRMPVMDGLEAAMHLMSMESPPSVIFTTAYDEHALDAFEVNAVDYLLKPIRRDRLAAALQKARNVSLRQLRMINEARDEPSVRTHISVQLRGKISLIPVHEVLYFMADSKYVTVRTAGERHLIEDSLVNLEDEFGERFLRVHRNALVAADYVSGIEKQPSGRWQIVFRDVNDRLDVSRRHTAAVRRWARR